VNSLDQELLEQAEALLAEVPLVMDLGWQDRYNAWLNRRQNATGNRPPPSRGRVADPWRDVDTAGDVKTDPTPDLPDDPDEGETGPPEQTLP
jgi:hypothetical protein